MAGIRRADSGDPFDRRVPRARPGFCLVMWIIYALALASLSLLGSGEGIAQGIVPTRGARVERLMEVARDTIGWKEERGNSGPLVDKILASVGLEGTGAPWCAAWVVYVGDKAFGGQNNPFPRSAWSPAFVVKPTWDRGKGRLPGSADAFGVYFHHLKRVAHTGLIERIEGKMAVTIEGNTNDDGSREGDGVYRKRRPLGTILARSWL